MNLDNLIIDGNFATILLWFAAYCFIGWIWESSYRSIRNHKFINSGFLTGPYIPIYGFGALGYIFIMHFTLNPIELFFIGGLLACAIEYITSWALEQLFHARWWDYSSATLNINGRVCLQGFIAFGAFAVILPYVHLFVGNIIDQINPTWRIILIIIFFAAFFTDLANTVRGLIKFNKTLRRLQGEIERQTAPLIEVANRNRNRFEMYVKRGQHRMKEIFRSSQVRLLRAFPNFRSVEYPEAFKRIRKLYEDSVKNMKDNQFKPIKTQKTKRKK